jgi:hypothetical protein
MNPSICIISSSLVILFLVYICTCNRSHFGSEISNSDIDNLFKYSSLRMGTKYPSLLHGYYLILCKKSPLPNDLPHVCFSIHMYDVFIVKQISLNFMLNYLISKDLPHVYSMLQYSCAQYRNKTRILNQKLLYMHMYC